MTLIAFNCMLCWSRKYMYKFCNEVSFWCHSFKINIFINTNASWTCLPPPSPTFFEANIFLKLKKNWIIVELPPPHSFFVSRFFGWVPPPHLSKTMPSIYISLSSWFKQCRMIVFFNLNYSIIRNTRNYRFGVEKLLCVGFKIFFSH